jgi:exopolyphosphatase/guanosine-5'-triphosphate,3'-diphosphate pyrophosphatase
MGRTTVGGAVNRTVAVIDVGTNSTNLLAVAADGTDLVRTVASTRLGEGLSTGVLTDAAIARTVEAVASHAATAESLGVASVTVTGTAACRRAANTTDLAAAIAAATGLDLEVLSEQDEARLTFDGALRGLAHDDVPTLVIDIGGGSTEYVAGVREAEAWSSIPFGAVTSTESHFSTDPPRPEDLSNLIGAVSDELEELTRTMPVLAHPGRVVGVAGTIVTVAAVELGLARFDDDALHGMELTREAAEDVFRTLATEAPRERAMNPGLPASRVDIIVAGCCILVATMRRLTLDALTVSTRSLLDGVAIRERRRA